MSDVKYILTDKVQRLICDLDNEINECRKEAARLSSKSDILSQWKLKIERDVLDENHLTFP